MNELEILNKKLEEIKSINCKLEIALERLVEVCNQGQLYTNELDALNILTCAIAVNDSN